MEIENSSSWCVDCVRMENRADQHTTTTTTTIERFPSNEPSWFFRWFSMVAAAVDAIFVAYRLIFLQFYWLSAEKRIGTRHLAMPMRLATFTV